MFCRRRWFQGRAIWIGISDIGWFTPRTEMSEEDWQAGFAKSLGVFLNGRGIATPNERGEPVVDETFYVMFNANHEPLDFTLPEAKWGEKWAKVLETDEARDEIDEEKSGDEVIPAGGKVRVQAWSLVLLRRQD